MTSGQLHIQPHNTMEVGNSNQELLSKGSKKRTTVVVLVVVIIVFVIASLLYFMKPSSTPLQASQPYRAEHKAISLKSYIDGEFNPTPFNGTWVSDKEIIYKSRQGHIMLYNAETNKSSVLLGRDLEIVATSFSYELSSDHRYMLLGRNYQKLYRHTFLAFYAFVELETMRIIPLTDQTGSEIQVQLVAWAPIGHAFAYVYMNDIYYRPSVREKNEEYRITRTGRPGTIYNGVPDWVYEEEIFGSNKALWFSPDGKFLTYGTFNDSRTPVMNIPYYGIPGELRFQYMQVVNIRYPKPGRPNPIVSLNLINLEEMMTTKVVKEIELPANPENNFREPVLFSVNWANNYGLTYVWMNRIQNEATIFYYSILEKKFRQILTIKEKWGWANLPKPLFSKNGRFMATILGVDQGEEFGSFRHLVLIDMESPNPEPVPLTTGKFVVTDIVDFDDSHIYFMANLEEHPDYLNVYRVPALVEGAPHKLECISCIHDKTTSGKCLYSGATFSPQGSYYVQTCAGPVVPEIRIYKKNGEKVTTWETNRRLRMKLERVQLPTQQLMEYEVSPGMKAQIQLQLPPNADLSGKTKYPVLVHVYGGPNTNSVTKRFKVDWDAHLVVNKSIIYVRIDGRGSGLKGDRMTFANYRNLGTYEVDDQINVTRHLAKTLPFIDETRIGIWGWSYGGYVSAMALARDDKDVFKCAVSVAPVTDWRLYDTLYTERFMGLPIQEDNQVGYEQASLFNKVSNFSRKKYLLIHGTLDDNVHYQQSMMLAKTLEHKDILFEQQSYPDEDHSLRDVWPHLYHSIENFLDRCFRREEK